MNVNVNVKQTAAGPRPAKLGENVWLAEVAEVRDGTGNGDERNWWCGIAVAYSVTEEIAASVARVAALRWYDETDQSGGACVVVMRVTAWSGETWTVEVVLAWQLTGAARAPVRMEGGGT
jgi:hypothetical protein